MDEFDAEFGFSRMSARSGEIDYATDIIVKHLNRDEVGKSWNERRHLVEQETVKAFSRKAS